MTVSTTFTNLEVTGTFTKNGTAVDTAVLLGTGEAVDLNGEAAGIILDADADTSISAAVDDTIDIAVAGAVDFRITANTLTSLSGSTIATNTIAETTAGSGVTADGVLLKDARVLAMDTILAVTADGAISIPAGNTTYFITKAGVAAMTIAAPTATTHDGLRLTFISTTAQAHTLDMASSGINGGSADIGTFGGAAGDGVTIEAYQAHWYEVPGSNANVSWA